MNPDLHPAPSRQTVAVGIKPPIRRSFNAESSEFRAGIIDFDD
jgi:hypothetical protein